MERPFALFSLIVVTLLLFTPAFAQSNSVAGKIHGTVRLAPSGTAVRNAVVTIAELKQVVLTDEGGIFEFQNIPRGKYQIIAHLDRVPDVLSTDTEEMSPPNRSRLCPAATTPDIPQRPIPQRPLSRPLPRPPLREASRDIQDGYPPGVAANISVRCAT